MCAQDMREPNQPAADSSSLLPGLKFSSSYGEVVESGAWLRDPAKFNAQRFTVYMKEIYDYLKARFELFVGETMNMSCAMEAQIRLEWPYALDIQLWLTSAKYEREYIVERGCRAIKLSYEERQTIEAFLRSVSLLRNVKFRSIGNGKNRYLQGVLAKRMQPKEFAPFYDN